MELALMQARLYPDSGSAAQSVGGGVAVYRPAPFPRSDALGMGMQGAVGETEVERMEDFYRSRGAPAQVALCPLADPSLLELLAGRGHRLAEWTNVLVRPLQPGDSTSPPPSLLVRQVPPAEAALWAQTMEQGFSGKEETTRNGHEIGVSLFQLPTARCFLALINGEPAGGGSVIWHEGVATLTGASTLPRFRKQGVQTALMQARLALAAAEGCDLATVITDPGTNSQRNAERQGFHVAYTRALLVRAWT